jgi:hypothetical protein
VLIAVFGASGTLDPFLAAFRIPDIVFALVAAGSIATVLVPQLSSLLEQGEQRRAQRLLGSVFIAMLSLLGLFSLVVVLGANALSGLLVGGLPSAQQREVADLSVILLVATIALALSAICTSAIAIRRHRHHWPRVQRRHHRRRADWGSRVWRLWPSNRHRRWCDRRVAHCRNRARSKQLASRASQLP